MSQAKNTPQKTAVIQRLDASGLSVAEFARQEGLSAWTLYGWRRQLSGLQAKANRSPGRFAEVQMPTDDRGRSDLELEFSDGTKLRMTSMDVGTLRGLVQELRSC